MQKKGTYNAEKGDLYTLLSHINTGLISHLKEIKKNKSNLKEKKEKNTNTEKGDLNEILMKYISSFSFF